MNIKGVMESRPRNYTVDMFRLLGAVSVIFLHTAYGSLNADLVIGLRMLCRWAVPYFFIISGYFYFISYSRDGNRAFSAILKNLISITIVANMIYFILRAYVGDLESIISIKTILLGDYFHLWFINCQIFAYIILNLLSKFLNRSVLLIFSVLLLLLNLLAEAYSPTVNHIFSFIPVKLSIALAYLTFGYCAALIVDYFSIRSAIFLSFIGLIFQFFESSYLKNVFNSNPFSQQFLFGTIFFSIGLFILSMKLYSSNDSNIASIGRSDSLAIYLYHPLFNFFLFKVMNDFEFWNNHMFSYVRPIVVLLVNLFLIILLRKKIPLLFALLNGKFSMKRIEANKCKKNYI